MKFHICLAYFLAPAAQAQMRVLLLDRLQRSHGLKLERESCTASNPMHAVADSLIMEFLRCSNMPYSLTVFQPESGLSAPLSHAEIVQLLHVSPSSLVGRELARRGIPASTGALCFAARAQTRLSLPKTSSLLLSAYYFVQCN